MQRRFQFLARPKMVALQHLLDPPVEALDHAVGLGGLGRGQAMLDAQFGAELVELMLARRGALAQAEQAIGELFSVIRENGADVDRAGALQVAQETSGVGRGLCLEDTDEDPAGRTVDGDEQVTPRGFMSHLRQILHVDMDVARLVGLEVAVFRPRRLGLKIAQVADAMPAQATVQARARDLRIQELPHHRQQIVERNQQRLAQRHGHGLLRRRQGGLQAVWRVAAVMHAVALAPFVDRLRRHTEPLGQHRPRLIARLDRRTHPGGRRCLLVKMDQHGCPPSRSSLKTDLAMNRADRRGEM